MDPPPIDQKNPKKTTKNLDSDSCKLRKKVLLPVRKHVNSPLSGTISCFRIHLSGLKGYFLGADYAWNYFVPWRRILYNFYVHRYLEGNHENSHQCLWKQTGSDVLHVHRTVIFGILSDSGETTGE